jgi:hypothetical protein
MASRVPKLFNVSSELIISWVSVFPGDTRETRLVFEVREVEKG